MLGANALTGGALLLSCCGGVKNVEGLTEGAGSCVGNPPDTVLPTSEEFRHPVVMLVNGNEVVHV